MPTYFKPLRRKIGVVTLVMALGILCVWGVGHSVLVAYSKMSGDGRWDAVGSSSNGFFWLTLEFSPESGIPQNGFLTGWEFAYVPSYDYLALRLPAPDWHWQLGGFHGAGSTANYGIPDSYSQTILVVPHWSIILPLTLFSGWLLLSRPRASNTSEKQG